MDKVSELAIEVEEGREGAIKLPSRRISTQVHALLLLKHNVRVSSSDSYTLNGCLSEISNVAQVMTNLFVCLRDQCRALVRSKRASNHSLLSV